MKYQAIAAIFLFLTLTSLAKDDCIDCISESKTFMTKKALSIADEVAVLTCLATRELNQCQKIEETHPENRHLIIQCDQSTLKEQSLTKTNAFKCTFNGIKMTAEQLVDLLKLPATLAQITLEGFKDEQRCSKDLKRKKELLEAFNLSISDPRFIIKESLLGRSFEDMSCGEIQKLLHARFQNYSQQMYREHVAAINSGKKNSLPSVQSEENYQLVKSIGEIMNLAKVNYECYTPKAKAEMMCSLLTSLATDIASGAVIAKGVQSLSKFSKIKKAPAQPTSLATTQKASKNDETLQAFRPSWMRTNKMAGEYRQILRRWKADSPKARELSEYIAYKQMSELGLKNYSFKITAKDLPTANASSETALKHPQMAEYLKKINEAGFELKINPHMAVDSDYGATLGRFNPPDKSIEILPHTTWEVFQHEYQHLVFWKLGLRNHAFVEDSLNATDQKIIARAKELYKKGFGRLAVDETMAVEAEIKALYKMGYTPWSGPVYGARQYAWSFQEKDIAKGLTGKAEATKLFLKKIALNPTLVRSALGVSALSTIYFNFEKGEVIVIDEKGETKKYKIQETNIDK